MVQSINCFDNPKIHELDYKHIWEGYWSLPQESLFTMVTWRMGMLDLIENEKIQTKPNMLFGYPHKSCSHVGCARVFGRKFKFSSSRYPSTKFPSNSSTSFACLVPHWIGKKRRDYLYWILFMWALTCFGLFFTCMHGARHSSHGHAIATVADVIGMVFILFIIFIYHPIYQFSSRWLAPHRIKFFSC